MKLFTNNYNKLANENKKELAELENQLRAEVNNIIQYCHRYGTSLFELEVIKKDLISLAKEAEIEHLTLHEKLGMPLKVFCENMIKETPSIQWFEHLLYIFRFAFGLLTWGYTIFFFSNNMPENFGISIFEITYILFIIISLYGITYFSSRFAFSENVAPADIEYIARFILVVIYFIITFALDDLNDELLIAGNGWLILIILSVLSLLLWLGGNYYWNKQSEKYNWE